MIVPTAVDPDYTPYRQKKTYPMTYFSYNVKDGSRRVFYDEKNWGHAHLQENPRKKDQWLFCLGRPAWLSSGKARALAKMKSEKMNIFDSKTGKKYVIKPRSKYKEVSHPSINYAGDRVIYHGQPKKGMYIGAVDLAGNTIWEYVFTNWKYNVNGSNHLGAHTRSNIIIEDGIVQAGCISFIDYSKAGKSGAPKVTTIARHDTEWKGLPGQLSHPHPHISPDGRYLAYNACHNGRTNLYIVDLKSRKGVLVKIAKIQKLKEKNVL